MQWVGYLLWEAERAALLVNQAYCHVGSIRSSVGYLASGFAWTRIARNLEKTSAVDQVEAYMHSRTNDAVVARRFLKYFTCRHCGTSYARAYTDDVSDPRFTWANPGERLQTDAGFFEAHHPLDILLEPPSALLERGRAANYDLKTGLLNPASLNEKHRIVYLSPRGWYHAVRGGRGGWEPSSRGVHAVRVLWKVLHIWAIKCAGSPNEGRSTLPSFARDARFGCSRQVHSLRPNLPR